MRRSRRRGKRADDTEVKNKKTTDDQHIAKGVKVCPRQPSLSLSLPQCLSTRSSLPDMARVQCVCAMLNQTGPLRAGKGTKPPIGMGKGSKKETKVDDHLLACLLACFPQGAAVYDKQERQTGLLSMTVRV